MNRPCAKFITSIRPKTSVSPDAMMKMSSPIATPATVSVTQVEGEPTRASEPSVTAASSATGTRSKAPTFTGAPPGGSLVSLQAQAEQAVLQRLVRREVGHAPGMDDAARVHYRHRVAERARGVEV